MQIKMRGACSSAGEHYVDIVGVTGSIPVTPTIFLKIFLLKHSVVQHVTQFSNLVVLVLRNDLGRNTSQTVLLV